MAKRESDGQLPPISGPRPKESPGESGAVPELEGYEITGRLGEGGMGTVWRAVQLSTHRQVALKLLSRGAFGSEKAHLRFEREVELTARLQHPNIAQIFDSGRHQGVPYYAMELIAGLPLDQYVQDHDLKQRQILELMRTVCEAVQHAHERGVIHRDLKPSNILVTRDGQPHILDFGLAKGLLEKDSALSLSTEGEAAGTPAYMSPEQAGGRAEQIDTRTDVYSLGVILFRLLTKELPHDLSGTRYEVLRRIAEEKVRRPRDITKDVEWELEALLLKALARDPKARYPYGGALAQDIENYLAGEPLTALPRTIAYFLRKWIRKYRGRVAIAFSVLAALIGVAVFAYVRIARERTKAVAAERSAEEALRKAQHENYYNVVALADARIADSHFDLAKAFLWNTPRQLRNWEWGRLMYVCDRKLLTLKGHSDAVHSVAFSPDGSRVVTASSDTTAKIWDAQTGREILTLKGHSSAVSSVAFSPDGTRLVTGSGDRTARIWDAESGQEILTLRGHTLTLKSVAFSPDGTRVVTGGDDETAKIWDAESGREVLTLKSHSAPVHCVAFSPDGERVATTGWDKTAKIWDARSGQEILTLKHHPQGSRYSGVYSVAFSPDGSRAVTGGQPGTAKVWDAETGQEILALKAHYWRVTSVAFSPDGKRVATGSMDATVKFWDVETGRELRTLKGHSNWVSSVAFSPDGKRVATASLDGTAKVWDAEGGGEMLTLKGHSDQVMSAAFSPKGKRLLSGCSDGGVKIWDAQTCEEMLTLKGHPQYVFSVAFSPGGKRVVTSSWDGTAKVWDAETGREMLTLKGHSGPVSSVAFFPDGKRVVTGSWDGTARVWDAETGQEILSLKGFRVVAVSPDGRRVATETRPEGTAKVWDAQTGQEILALKGHPRRLNSVAFSRDGERVVTGSGDMTAKVWDAKTGREIVTLKGHSSSVLSVAFSPDGKRAVTGSAQGTARIWDAKTGREILTLRGHFGPVNSVAFSPDGKRVVMGCGDGTVRIWDAFDWELTPEELERQKREP